MTLPSPSGQVFSLPVLLLSALPAFPGPWPAGSDQDRRPDRASVVPVAGLDCFPRASMHRAAGRPQDWPRPAPEQPTSPKHPMGVLPASPLRVARRPPSVYPGIVPASLESIDQDRHRPSPSLSHLLAPSMLARSSVASPASSHAHRTPWTHARRFCAWLLIIDLDAERRLHAGCPRADCSAPIRSFSWSRPVRNRGQRARELGMTTARSHSHLLEKVGSHGSSIHGTR